MSVVIATVILLGGIGAVGALVLYATSRRFHVATDPREEQILAVLPGANCGACGCKGCADFAAECVKRGKLEGLVCPGAGAEGMTRVASILGVSTTASEPTVAVLHCNGTCRARPQRYAYDGASSCAVMAAVGTGSRGCSFGCLGCGDCVAVCRFGALTINPETGLPEVDAAKCTGCGMCARECPRRLFEMRPRGRNGRRVWVACSSHDPGATARKICTAACIGCGKCAKVCPFEAITIDGFLSYINPEACRACGKCIGVCPTGAILSTFPKPVVKKDEA